MDYNTNSDYNINEYINIIDVKLDEYLNELYGKLKNTTVSLNNDIILNLIKLISKFIDNLDYSDLTKIVSLDTSIETIKSIMNKYYFYYVILRLSFGDISIDELRKSFIKLINISNNLPKYDYIRIDPETIDSYLKNIQFIRNINLVIDNIDDLEKIKDQLKKNIGVLNFLNSLGGKEFIINQLSKDNIHHRHNITKLVLLKLVYVKNDRPKVYQIIEDEEYNTAEKRKITIVESLLDQFDFSYIEKILGSEKPYTIAYSQFIYDLITEYDNRSNNELTTDYILEELFRSRIIIPITDEFLRYHKDGDKYEKSSSIHNIDPNIRTNKRDNSKIRYIITKINDTINLYNKTNKKYDDAFYNTLIYRKAIIINDIEEIHIINKILNIASTSNKSLSNYYDLIDFRKYPYINFMDYKTYGFRFKIKNTSIETIRYCNFEYPLNSSILQTRIASSDDEVKIVGVALNKYNLGIRKNHDLLNCIKNNNNVNISQKVNGCMNLEKLLRDYILNDYEFKKLPYWLFNFEIDGSEKYILNQEFYKNISISKITDHEEYYKFLIKYIYHTIQELLYEKIINNFSILKITSTSFYSIQKYIKTLQINYISLNNYLDTVYNILFYNYLSLPAFVYDKNEDIIPGLNTKLNKLPIYQDIIKLKSYIKVKKYELITGYTEVQEGIDTDFAICQHLVTWNILSSLRKYDPNKFYQGLSEFIKKFVIESGSNEYVCKSCFQLVEIKNFVSDSFNQSLQNIALNITLEANLETLSEYEKYNKAIKNMDKIVEKLAYIIGIQYYLGNSNTLKYRRQNIIKNVIDIINIQNATINKEDMNFRRTRSERANKLYGISKLSSFFIFEMDNNIFTYSSRDTDKYKRYKNNNIIVYVILFIIIDLDLGQINSISHNVDKIINYNIFEKYGKKLFSNLYLRINNSDTIKPMLDYELLCYIIYFITGIISKYNFWFVDENTTVQKKNMVNPLIQNIIINTFVDLLNSILEINSQKTTKNYLYGNIATKFFNKLYTLYNNINSQDIINYIKSLGDKKTNSNKINLKLFLNIKTLPLNGKFDTINFIYDKLELSYLYHLKSRLMTMYYNNNLKTKYSHLSDTELINIYDKLATIHKLKIIQNYDINGVKYNVAKIDIIKNLSQDQIYKNYYQIVKSKLDNIKKIMVFDKNILTYSEITNIDEIKNVFINTSKSTNKIIDILINNLEEILGKDINLLQDNTVTKDNEVLLQYLKTDVFIIDHNISLLLEKPIILESNALHNIIVTIKSHKFYNQDVIQYYNKQDNIYFYYDAFTKLFIGYKESNKDNVRVSNSKFSIKIIYSIYNKLKYIGFEKLYYKIDPDVINNKYKLKQLIASILTSRLQNLKMLIINYQSLFFKLRNNDINISFKHLNNIKNNRINYIDADGLSIFHYFNDIVNNYFIKKIDSNNYMSKYSNDQYLNIESFIKLGNTDEFVLFYFINQILYQFNLNKSIKLNNTQLALLVVYVILYYYDKFMFRQNTENIAEINAINSYVTLYDEFAYIKPIDQEPDINTLSEEQQEILLDELTEEKERADAIDVDIEVDPEDEDNPDNEVIYKDRQSNDY